MKRTKFIEEMFRVKYFPKTGKRPECGGLKIWRGCESFVG
jgi:hypothetical protein